MMAARAFLSTLAAVALLASPEATPRGDRARTFLATAFSVPPADLERIDAGQVYSRSLDVSHSREVATLGIVRIKTTPAFYVERLADIASFKRDEAILQIGTFGNPPHLQDIAELTLEDADVRRLRDCRVGNCGVQLSADAIERFQKDVDWRRPDVQRQANSVMRHVLVDYVTQYMETGASAAMEYADKPHALNLGGEFISLVEADPGTWQYFPALRRHLIGYPGAMDSKGTFDMVYWSKERVNRRPVISATHLAIFTAADDSPADYAIASKHIYGMHYFDASLGLTLLLREQSAPSPVTYVLYLNRTRIDLFDGVLGRIARKVVGAKARSLVSEQLARLQRTLERQFVTRQTDGLRDSVDVVRRR